MLPHQYSSLNFHVSFCKFVFFLFNRKIYKRDVSRIFQGNFKIDRKSDVERLYVIKCGSEIENDFHKILYFKNESEADQQVGIMVYLHNMNFQDNFS